MSEPICLYCRTEIVQIVIAEEPPWWVHVHSMAVWSDVGGTSHRASPAPQMLEYDDTPPKPVFADSIQTKFEEFHAKHPGVYEALVSLAYEAQDAGRKRVGMAQLFEVLRWQMMSWTDGDYKLNNNFRSRYARLIMRQEETLSDMFEIRSLSA